MVGEELGGARVGHVPQGFLIWIFSIWSQTLARYLNKGLPHHDVRFRR